MEKDKLEIQTKELEKINFNKDTVIHSNCTCSRFSKIIKLGNGKYQKLTWFML